MEVENLPILIKELGNLTYTENSKRKFAFALYKCGLCGNEFKANMYHIKTGHTRSCGCLNPRYTHNLAKHRLYKTWCNMRNRCYNQEFKQYKDYGGRGIKICEEWLDVVKFIKWVDEESNWEEGLSLDRIDNDSDYSPENCRFVTGTIQSINQRISKKNKTGYVGVGFVEKENRYKARVSINNKTINIGYFKTLEEAVQARDQYIIDNDLPHKLSKDYKEKENEN